MQYEHFDIVAKPNGETVKLGKSKYAWPLPETVTDWQIVFESYEGEAWAGELANRADIVPFETFAQTVKIPSLKNQIRIAFTSSPEAQAAKREAGLLGDEYTLKDAKRIVHQYAKQTGNTDVLVSLYEIESETKGKDRVEKILALVPDDAK